MATSDFTTTLLLDQTPEEVFQAVTNVRGWWSEEIEGGTEKEGDEFRYHHKDVHYCKMRLTEVVPGKKVVWLVLDNYFNFIQDENEWKGTEIIFEIARQNEQTQLRFTHKGLVPAYECFEICRDAWTNYIQNSLRSLIATGQGQPNPKEGGFNDWLLRQHTENQTRQEPDYHLRITVPATAHEAFNGINGISKWWTINMEGRSEKPGDAFTVRFGDVHMSTQKLVEVIPDEKVVWLVTDSLLNFLEDKEEWTNTKICFEISRQGDQTHIDFTHFGLAPKAECYGACVKAWDYYVGESLFKLLTEGKGMPEAVIL